ncbi:MAG: TonB-dependent siderophore receptor [Steroidobacter sp.]|nr:TonB-dependent siderophore receptor [Steroidobacter sp.]
MALIPITAVAAESQQANIAFNVPRQAAASGILEFARQADIQILVSQKALQGRNTAEVSGSFSLEQGLSLLLTGSGLTIASSDGKTVMLEPLANTPTADVLETINVFGTLDDEVNVGSKTGASLRETPKSVTIVSRERIEAQNLTTIANVMKQATGVTVRDYGPSGGWFFSRGYRLLTSQVDGGAPITEGFGNVASPDSAIYESVEVLRGVDGIYSGAGDPGGVINMVRKRALGETRAQIDLSAGRWDNYRGQFDITGPLTAAGDLRGRLVAVYEDRGYYWDRAESKKSMLYGVLEKDLGSATTLSLGFTYEDADHDAFDLSGLPFYADGRSVGLPRSANLAADWSGTEVTSKEVFVKAEHTFANDWVIKMNASHREQKSESVEMFTRGPVDSVTNIIPGTAATGATATANSRHPERDVIDLFLRGSFSLFNRDHVFAVGADHSEMNGDGSRSYGWAEYPVATRRPVDVINFDPSLFPRPSTRVLSSYAKANNQVQSGIYASVGLQLAEPLKLTLGGRYSEYEVESETIFATNGVLNPNSSFGANYKDTAFVPSVAVTYDIASNWTMYASYAESFAPQANLLVAPLPGTPMDPIVGEGYEFGIKATLFDNVNAALALYRVRRNGQGVRDDSYPLVPGTLGSACCYIDSGDVTTQGMDIEFSGTILPGWQLFAGYTYSDRESSRAATNSFQSSALYFAWTPKHLFKSWTTWNLPGALSKWTLNAGAHVQSEFSGYTTSPAFGIPRQGGYAIWNASVQYRVNDNLTAALYAENLFDKTYYEAMSMVRVEGLYGVPRNLLFRMQFQF